MKWRRSQGNAKWLDEGVVGAGEMDPAGEVTGWSMSSGAAANRAALVRWTAWAVIISGPLLGGMAFLSSATSAGATAPPVVQSVPSVPAGTGPAGFAELFVSAYLSAGQGDQGALAAFWPGAKQEIFEGTPGARQVTQIAAVRTVAVTGGLWSVTVGARVIEPDAQPTVTPSAGATATSASEPGLRYFQVAIASVGDHAAGRWAYSALAAPAEVAAPATEQAPKLAYGPLVPAGSDDARAQTVEQFLTAYLTGAGGGALDRYLSPGVQMDPVTPAPYTSVEVDQIAAAGPGADRVSGAAAVPKNGTQQQVLVTVRATGRDSNRVPLAYAFTLTARAGRWEITSLDPAPLPAVTAAPAATPPPGTTPPVTTTPAP